MTTFPKSPMGIFRIMRKVMEALYNDNSIFGNSIKNALSENVPYRQIIATIQSQGRDNPRLAIELFGTDLWAEIESFR